MLLAGQLLKKHAPTFCRSVNERIRLMCVHRGPANSERQSRSAKAQKLTLRIAKLTQLIRGNSNQASSAVEMVMNAGDPSAPTKCKSWRL